jgi:hypothetical protein
MSELPTAKQLQRRHREMCASGARPKAGVVTPAVTYAPAHGSTTFLLAISDRVRVISDDLQWIVQVRRGKARARNSGWHARHFCRSRVGLQLALRQIRGRDDPPAAIVAQVTALPEWHHQWLEEAEHG